MKRPQIVTRGAKHQGRRCLWGGGGHLRLGVAVNMQSEAKRNEFTKLCGSEGETKGEEKK